VTLLAKAMANPRILITGFTPFSTFHENISQEMTREISKRGLDGIEIEHMILTVDEKGSNLISDIISEELGFSAVLHLGYSDASESIRLEMAARNRFGMKIPDNSGRIIESGPIVPGAPSKIAPNFPLSIIQNSLRDLDSVTWSDDAGGFVCNETYFRTLLAISHFNVHQPNVLLLHLPGKDKISFDEQLPIIEKIARILCSLV